MKTIQLSRASRPLAEYARELKGDILVLTDAKAPVAAIVPLKGVDGESIALSAHPEFLELIERSRAQFAAGQTLSLDEMKEVVLPKRKSNHPLQPTRKRRGRLNR
jgi:antitoxin (DNA-binding transcriptional repressor) of toxin-antitoxin stability system